MTKARDLSNIVSSGVPNNLINLDANEIPSLDTAKITTGTFADARIPNLDASKITTGTIADARISSAIANQKSDPYRNIIINGDMSIAQRSTSVAGITIGGYKTLDRFTLGLDNLGTFTMSQSTDVPTGQGFAKSLKMECTTADASPASSDYLQLNQVFEGQMLQYLKKGTANAQSLTLSFWVKSNKTGTYIGELVDLDNSRSISKSFTINSADTWEQKTITYAGDTTGAFDNDNSGSLALSIWLGAGTNFTSGTLATTWGSITNANRVVGQVNLADSTSNYINFTGLQLEAGTTASDFEFLPYDVNWRRCLRYYETCYPYGDTIGGARVNDNGAHYGGGTTGTTTTGFIEGDNGYFQVEKRTTPTMYGWDNPGNSGKCNRFTLGGSPAGSNNNTLAFQNTTAKKFWCFSSGGTASGMYFWWVADAEL